MLYTVYRSGHFHLAKGGRLVVPVDALAPIPLLNSPDDPALRLRGPYAFSVVPWRRGLGSVVEDTALPADSCVVRRHPCDGVLPVTRVFISGTNGGLAVIAAATSVVPKLGVDRN